MDYELNEIVLAAWLHGANVFRQATQDGNANVADFRKAILESLPSDVNAENVESLMNSYKSSDSFYANLLAQSINLSAGKADYVSKTENTVSKPLINIISKLKLQERTEPKHNYLTPAQLKDDAIINFSEKGSIKKSNLYSLFLEDLKKLKECELKYNEFLPALVSLLEYYWWCVPTSDEQQDVSLFQHSKMTAAFAASLYQYHAETNTLNDDALNDNTKKKFRVISGDVSGIQKYIFDLKISKNAAKLLRARSFQLWALSVILSDYITKEFHLTSANVITTAGGKFLILLQNTDSTKPLIEQMQAKFETYFLKEFAGKLFFILSDGVEFSPDDFMSKDISDCINKIGFNTEEAKQYKMQKVLKESGHVLNELYAKLQQYGTCNFCDTFPAEKKVDNKDSCSACKNLIDDIGGKLVKANKIIFHTDKLKDNRPFSELINIVEIKDAQKNNKEFGFLINTFKAGYPMISLPYVAPKDKYGNIKSFEEIAGSAKGVQNLAMFKADIDNLGLVFTSSLGAQMSLSRYAEISRLFHYFFSTYYTYFVETKYKDKIYTVFSGGDDLCVIGTWNEIMDFAYDFRTELNKLTNNNPSITLSGGIALASSSLPVRTIANMAEAELDHAKDFKDDDGKPKNATSVFDTSLNWEEYKKYLEYGKDLDKCIEGKTLATAPVYRLIHFANRAKSVRKEGNIKDSVWVSHYRYMYARNIKKDNKNRELTTEEKIFGEFGSPKTIEKARISASYALYANRKNSQNGGGE